MPERAADQDAVVSIADVVTSTGLSADTLRFYERRGLLPPVTRTSGGQRRYTGRDLERLEFLLRLRDTGMPLATMRRFADLRRAGEAGRPGRLAILLEHRRAVRRRMDDLVQNLHAIDLKVDRHRRLLRQRGTADVSQDDEFIFRPIHHVQLAIPRDGEDACRAFWNGVLGMRELEKPPVLAARGGCWFRGGALEVHLGVEEPFAPARKAHPGLLVDGLRALARRLEDAGHQVTWDDDFPATTASTPPTRSATAWSSYSPSPANRDRCAPLTASMGHEVSPEGDRRAGRAQGDPLPDVVERLPWSALRSPCRVAWP